MGGDLLRTFEPDDKMPVRRLSEDGILVWKSDIQSSIGDHNHRFVEFSYVFSGEMTHRINGVDYPCGKGDLVYINFGQTHAYELTGTVTLCNILIQPEFLSSELIDSLNAGDMLNLSVFSEFSQELDFQPRVRFSGEDLNRAEKLIGGMIDEFDQRSTGYRGMLKAMTTQLIILVLRKIQEQSGTGELMRQLGSLSPQLLKYMEENLSEHLSLTELAKRCCYSPAYFSRIFKRCFGKTVTAYLQEKRMGKAKYLLRHSNINIADIAAQVGYTDRKQFYSIFYKLNGMTPGDYRRNAPSTD